MEISSGTLLAIDHLLKHKFGGNSQKRYTLSLELLEMMSALLGVGIDFNKKFDSYTFLERAVILLWKNIAPHLIQRPDAFPNIMKFLANRFNLDQDVSFLIVLMRWSVPWLLNLKQLKYNAKLIAEKINNFKKQLCHIANTIKHENLHHLVKLILSDELDSNEPDLEFIRLALQSGVGHSDAMEVPWPLRALQTKNFALVELIEKEFEDLIEDDERIFTDIHTAIIYFLQQNDYAGIDFICRFLQQNDITIDAENWLLSLCHFRVNVGDNNLIDAICQSCDLAKARLLVLHGLPVSVFCEPTRQNFVLKLIQNGKIEWIEFLLTHIDDFYTIQYQDPSPKNLGNKTTFFWACWYRQDKIAVAIAQQGIKKDEIWGETANTLLHLSAQRGLYATSQCLVEYHDFDPQVRNTAGITPIISCAKIIQHKKYYTPHRDVLVLLLAYRRHPLALISADNMLSSTVTTSTIDCINVTIKQMGKAALNYCRSFLWTYPKPKCSITFFSLGANYERLELACQAFAAEYPQIPYTQAKRIINQVDTCLKQIRQCTTIAKSAPPFKKRTIRTTSL